MGRVVSLCVVIFLVSFIVVGTAQPAGAQVIRLRHWWTTASPLQPGSPDGLGSLQRGPGGNRDLSTSGVQYGADVYVPFGGRWYVTGSATFGNWPIRHTLLGVPDLPEGMTSISDYSATLGKWLTPTVAAEVGWRSIYWNTGPVGSTPCPCTMSWDGWYGGLTLRMP